MKRLISILVVFAMMVAMAATAIPALAVEVNGNEETPLATYNVNWKELAEGNQMRAQWLYDRAPGHNTMPYVITATDVALTLATDGSHGGDHRQYYSEVMFPMTADTQYVYELEAKSTGSNGGFLFAYSENNPDGRDEDDRKQDKEGNAVDYLASSYFVMSKLTEGSADLKFGGYWPNYGYKDSVNLSQNIENAKLTEDGYAKYKVVYTGFTVEIFYLDATNAWVELYPDTTITLANNAKVAFGVYTNGPNYGCVRNCTVYAMNEAAKTYLSVDKTALAAKISDAKVLEEDKDIYTPESWAEFFPAAIEKAEEVYKNATSQTAVDAALEELNTAMDALEFSPASDKAALNAAIEAAKALNPADYAELSQVKLAAAIDAAEAEAAKDINVNEENKAIAALNVVVAGLIDKDFTATAYYNVNWKNLVEGGTMRTQWCYQRNSSHNNFESKYYVNATENALTLTPTGGENRQYYSELMVELNENTYFVYDFEVNTHSYVDGGVVFAWAADPNAFVQSSRPAKDAEDDIYPGVPKAAYSIQGNLSNGSSLAVQYGGPYRDAGLGYVLFGTKDSPNLENVKKSEDGYAKYRVIYDGLTIEIFYENTNGEYVEAFADKTMTLVEGSRVAFGVTVWTPDYADLRNCKLTAYNDPAADAIAKAPLEYAITVAAKLENKAANYTPGTFEPMLEALAGARAALAAGVAENYDAAAEALLDAVAALKKPANKSELLAKISAAEYIINSSSESDYTSASWSAFETAYESARAIYEDINVSVDEQDAVNAETDALTSAIERLTAAGEANKVDLIIAVKRYEALVETDYTPATWATLTAPYFSAAALYTNDSLTEADQANIDAATVALNNAIDALVERANFPKLQALVNRVEALDKTAYKAETWAIDAPLVEAKAVLADLNNSQEVVDAAIEALQAAYDALETIRTNVLLITVPEDYEINDKVSYPPETATYYNKITDMSYHGLGNVFYYDYHKVVANAGFSAGWQPGMVFEKSMKEMGILGDSSYVLRLGRNNGSGTNRAVNGIKVKDDAELVHQSRPTLIGDKKYGHVFGFSFREAPTFDSIAVYLPTDSIIASIDVYGANLAVDAEGNAIYGKADSDKIINLDANGKELRDETPLTAEKVYLGTIEVPAAEAGAENILAEGKLMAFKAEYVYFALTFKDGTADNAWYSIYEIELYGFNPDEEGVADFSVLSELYTKCITLDSSEYTPLSWKGVADAVAEHNATVMSVLSTQAEVDAAVAAFDNALNSLVYKAADFTALDVALNTADLFDGKDAEYTPETYGVLKAAVETAKALKAQVNVSQSLVDSAAKAINEAIAGLIKTANKTVLNATIDKALTYVEEDWQGNVIAWKMFEKALAEAIEIKDDPNVTQLDVDEIVASIEVKMLELVPTPRANKTALKAQIDSAMLYKEDEWQGNRIAWRMFESQLTSAIEVYETKDATQEQVDSALALLKSRLSALEETPDYTTVDKTKLENLIKKVKEELVQSDYTAESWASLASALKIAENVYKRLDADEIDVDTAVRDLQGAVDALVRFIDTTNLEAAIAEATGLNKDDYTQISYERLTWALNDGRKMLNEVKTNPSGYTQADVDIIVNTIKERIEALVIKETQSETETETETETIPEDESETESETEKETEKQTANKESATDEDEEEVFEDLDFGSCGSSIALSSLATVAVIGAALTLKKKKED